ncbi:hypothetical protein UFOVP115_105 [uncultured Caudovirales phage]|uniref:Uncharacterized protein n=1 Tax=uncultured Caudovirales phage TaxID=2100421 RepID=A0A6J5L5U4_9CAUD|nr:hypothetical protein UFOVP115_105 [uncultured Caudovirales phage]
MVALGMTSKEVGEKREKQMLTNRNTIESRIKENWEYLSAMPHPEDMISELAESEVPVYTHEIISEWSDLPTDARDEWVDVFVVDDDTTIATLMGYDLFLYYQSEFFIVFGNLTAEAESEVNA